MDIQQGFNSGSGVVLRRRIAGEGDILLALFLKGLGLTYASARGAASGKVRFGGGTEPLMWGSFKLYKGKGGGYHLKSVDVFDDMLKLRGRASTLFASVRWAKLLMRYLLAGHPSDDLLANFYWNMKLLNDSNLPAEVVEFRFLWRWLKSWGLAPGLPGLAQNETELAFLRVSAEAKMPELVEYMTKHPLFDRRLFARAGRRLEGLLVEI